MHDKLTWLAVTALGMALLVGALIPFQAAANAHAGRTLGHPFWGAALSLGISLLVTLPILALAKAPQPNLAGALQGPWWLWIGGVLGALYVASTTVLVPRLGAGNFLVAVIAGQMVTAIVIDHFGLMGLETRPLSLTRVAGVLMMLGGVLLVQKRGY